MSETPPEIRQLHQLAADWLASKGPGSRADFIVEAPGRIEGVTGEQARAAFDHESSRLFGAAAAGAQVVQDTPTPPPIPSTATALIDTDTRRKPPRRWAKGDPDHTVLGGLAEAEDMVLAMAEESWFEDPRTGTRRLKLPDLFAKAAKLQLEAVDKRIRGSRELLAIDRLQGFAKGVAHIVFEHAEHLPPEVRQAIAADVRALYVRYFETDRDLEAD
jgi:hypothetical protein